MPDLLGIYASLRIVRTETRSYIAVQQAEAQIGIFADALILKETYNGRTTKKSFHPIYGCPGGVAPPSRSS
jgi:hypothetical protein